MGGHPRDVGEGLVGGGAGEEWVGEDGGGDGGVGRGVGAHGGVGEVGVGVRDWGWRGELWGEVVLCACGMRPGISGCSLFLLQCGNGMFPIGRRMRNESVYVTL